MPQVIKRYEDLRKVCQDILATSQDPMQKELATKTLDAIVNHKDRTALSSVAQTLFLILQQPAAVIEESNQ